MIDYAGQMRRSLTILPLALLIALICLGEGSPGAAAGEPEAKPVELGAVGWHRSFDDAAKIARHAKKALLVVFQEVPG